MNSKDGGPAFPLLYPEEQGGGADKGMTLRDYFAIQALSRTTIKVETSIKRNLEDTLELTRESSPLLAEMAYIVADAMLAERDKE